MSEAYLKRLRRALHLPRRQKAEILRDIEEAFASAWAHGETAQQVVERLGCPEELAAAIHERLGIVPPPRRLWLRRVAVAAFVCALLVLGLLAHSRIGALPHDVIGAASSLTALRVMGAGLPVPLGLLGLSFVALLLGAYLWYQTKK